jgi:inosine/xanthosine triphosphatase
MAFPKRKNIQEQQRQNLVIVGSRNPVKISCTEAGFHQAFDSSYLVEGLNVGSVSLPSLSVMHKRIRGL